MITDFIIATGVGSLIAFLLWTYENQNRPQIPEEILDSLHKPLLTGRDYDSLDENEIYHGLNESG